MNTTTILPTTTTMPTTTTTLPTLYCNSKNGKTKEWRIKVEQFISYSNIIISFGYTGSTRFIETTRTISKGKNIGKTNATTHFTQALAEANAKWKKKCDNEGFVEFINNESQAEKEKEVIYLPMLAQDYKKHFSKIRFPCYLQPKLDGFRCLHTLGTSKLWSRVGKEFLNCDHILADLNKLNKDFKGITLDGELYCHGGLFEDLGVLRKKKLGNNDVSKMKKISYWIYDIVDENLTFEERLEKLKLLKQSLSNENSIRVLDTVKINTIGEIKEIHKENIEKGYEGTMIRNSFSKYLQKYRSYDLQKYKDFQDAEFTIVGYTKEQGDLIVFICETETKQLFNVPCKGTKDERHSVFLEAKKYIGKKLWVQFFEYTADGIPRFPKSYRNVRESIRNCIM